MALFPCLALSLVVLGFNLFGDATRDVLAPVCADVSDNPLCPNPFSPPPPDLGHGPQGAEQFPSVRPALRRRGPAAEETVARGERRSLTGDFREIVAAESRGKFAAFAR
jgi:hypothetical protein